MFTPKIKLLLSLSFKKKLSHPHLVLNINLKSYMEYDVTSFNENVMNVVILTQGDRKAKLISIFTHKQNFNLKLQNMDK